MATSPSAGRQTGPRPAPPFDDVYREHHRRVFAICLGYLGNSDDAEDATQETFVKAAPHLVGFEGNVAAYLTVVARNVCCDEVRRRTLHRRATGELGRRGGHQEIESRAVDRSVLSRLLPRLTRGERELLLHSFAGYSYDEIADRMGAPVGTVRVRLARARKRARGLASGLAGVLLLGRWGWMRRAGTGVPGSQQGTVVAGALVAGVVAVSLASGFGVPGSTRHGLPPLTGGVADTAVRPPDTSGLGGAAPAVPTTPTPATAAAPGSSASRGSGAGGVAATPTPQVLVPHGYEVTPDQAWGDGLSTSRSASGPVFLWGRTGASCTAVCELLYRSDDGGHTWQQLAAQGFRAGQLLVPDSFGSNHTLFDLTQSSLLVSRDGGQSFGDTGVVAGRALAAAMPDDGSGHARVIVESGLQLTAYDAQTSTSSHWGSISTIDYTGVVDMAYAGRTLLVSVERSAVADTGTETPAAVLACTPGCTEKSHGFASPSVSFAPVMGDASTVLIVDDDRDLYETTDGGKGARIPSTLPGDAVKVIVARAGSSGIDVLLQSQATAVDDTLLRAGATVPLHSVPNGEAETFLVLPGDAILAAGADVNGASLPGIRCSHDLGATWTQRC